MERKKDKEDKEAFEARLMARDESKTKYIKRENNNKEEEEEEELVEMKTEEIVVEKLREYSRQEYLVKREEKKIQELKDAIQDEEYLFAGIELTEKEKAESRRRKKLLEVAEEHRRQLDKLKIEGYQMPEDYDETTKEGREKKNAALYERYKFNYIFN